MLLDGQPPGGVVPAQPDAPVEGPGIDLGAVEGGRDQVVLGLDGRPGEGLAMAAYVFDLVGRALADGVLGHLGTDRDPVNPGGKLDAAVGLDGQRVALGVQGADELDRKSVV